MIRLLAEHFLGMRRPVLSQQSSYKTKQENTWICTSQGNALRATVSSPPKITLRSKSTDSKVVHFVHCSLLGGWAHMVHSGNCTGNDVVDECEVALQFRLAGTLEDVDRLSCLNLFGEREGCHVGSPPRPIHSEESQADHGQAEDVVVVYALE